ncbi:hypothetical protein ACFPJ1_09275 [Kribbella qitaiheensis]|uniref:protein kinase domain-containing protein n=1 Tax=Kribbella qitaiheensis TaxID=1544730 RepID=UPI003620FC41
MTGVATPVEPPQTELDPVAGEVAKGRPDVGPGQVRTLHDDESTEAVVLSTHPDEWSDLTLQEELASSAHSRVTRFATADGKDVVVKAFRVLHQDVLAVWRRWESCRAAGAPLTPLDRTSLGPAIAFEQMPYRPERSLYELLTADDQFPHRRRSTEDLKRIARQVDEALTALHRAGADHRYAVHRDVKPGNILVTQLDPLVVELADTETVVLVDPLDTATALPRRGTFLYEAADASYAAHPPMDYWSLGMTLAELGAGRHPLQRIDVNEFFEPAFIQRLLTEDLLEVPAELEEETAVLVRGLLARRSGERFGHPEIVKWLDGQPLPTPAGTAVPNARGSAEQADDAAATRVRAASVEDSFVLAGMLLHTRQAIAAAMAEHWGDAVRTLLGRDYDQLLDWVADHCPELAAQIVSIRDRRQAGLINVHRAVAETIWSLDPASPPSFDGRVLDRAGLIELVRAVIATDAEASTVLDRLRESSALEVLALRPAHQELQHVTDRWQELVAAADRLLARHLPPGRTVDRTLLHAHLLLVILSPDAVRHLAELAAACLNDRTAGVPWFTQLSADGGGVDGAARHAVMIAAAPIAEGPDPGVHTGIDAWASDYLERIMNARLAQRRSRFGFTPAVYAAVAVVLGLVALQTWALAARSVTAYVLTSVGVAVLCVLGAVRMPSTNLRALLLHLGAYGLIGAFAGGAVAAAFALAGGDIAGLVLAWWLWGLAELLAVVVTIRGSSRVVSRKGHWKS